MLRSGLHMTSPRDSRQCQQLKALRDAEKAPSMKDVWEAMHTP